MMLARIFTLYPEFFPGPLGKGLYGKALAANIWELETVNIRNYATDKHKTVDDTTYGGGSGMLIKPDVLANSLDKNLNSKERIIYLSPKGKLFNQKLAKELSKERSINLICGHFEGVDQRVIESRNIEEVSIGDFVLSGGESAAFVMLDSIIRLLPGVLGNEESLKEESHTDGALEYPHYTKPETYTFKRGILGTKKTEASVPPVLTSGNHAAIEAWRKKQSELKRSHLNDSKN